MSYLVIIENRAQKEYKKISHPFVKNILSHISALEHNPRPFGSKKLTGSKDGYRIRIGDYRVLYTIDDGNKVVTIYRIRHRKEAYD